tara:strand:+ start:695 stop:1471 length:777 start_codon:yes stop_codon:yes gene_type:complete
MNFNSEQLEKNWNQLIQLIKDTFPEDYPNDRREKLLNMYHHFEERMVLAPASGRNYYHNCFPGGYVDHVLRVVNFSRTIYDLWKNNGADVSNYSESEVIFVALHHDLGKIGDLENDYYIPNESEWHRKNQGKIYNHNPELQYMTVPDRAVWLLGKFTVDMTECEYLGIKLTDGLYDKANEPYYMSYLEENQLRYNLPFIVHQADSMAARIEKEQYTNSRNVDTSLKKEFTKSIGNNRSKKEEKNLVELKKQFDELFKT